MKIGLMLRGVLKRGGTGVYTRNLVPELLTQGADEHWTLIYGNAAQVGTLPLPANAREVVLASANPLWWDQYLVPTFARREQLDLLFHVKWTVPLTGRVPAVMALHGASWYARPPLYPWWDRLYIKTAMPHYCRRAAHMISNSQCTTRDYVNIIGARPEKITTIPLAAAPSFRRVTDDAEIARVRARYGLPEGFILAVAAHDPRKNVPRLLEAFLRCRRRRPCKLVLVGRNCVRYREELPGLASEVGEDMFFTDWVDQEDLPVLYTLATVFFFPSVYEEFGIPNCEAMACGTPILTSNTAAPPDVVGDAGILVDPYDVPAMAAALERLLEDEKLRAELSARGLRRSRLYSWHVTARETLGVLRRFA